MVLYDEDDEDENWNFQTHWPLRGDRVLRPGEKFVELGGPLDIIHIHKNLYGTEIRKTSDIMPTVRGIIQSKFN